MYKKIIQEQLNAIKQGDIVLIDKNTIKIAEVTHSLNGLITPKNLAEAISTYGDCSAAKSSIVWELVEHWDKIQEKFSV